MVSTCHCSCSEEELCRAAKHDIKANAGFQVSAQCGKRVHNAHAERPNNILESIHVARRSLNRLDLDLTR